MQNTIDEIIVIAIPYTLCDLDKNPLYTEANCKQYTRILLTREEQGENKQQALKPIQILKFSDYCRRNYLAISIELTSLGLMNDIDIFNSFYVVHWNVFTQNVHC